MALFSGYSRIHALTPTGRASRVSGKPLWKEREKRGQTKTISSKAQLPPHLDMVATKSEGFCPKGERMDARLTEGLPLAKPACAARMPRRNHHKPLKTQKKRRPESPRSQILKFSSEARRKVERVTRYGVP
jgi:hypothetical protein